METLSILLEATLDGDFLSGLDVETLVSGKNAANCEDAAAVMRIKRIEIISETRLSRSTSFRIFRAKATR